jgi:hypothetical protein
LDKRIPVRLLSTPQSGQAGDAGSNAPGFIAREQTGSRAPAGFILAIDEGKRLLVRVPDDEARLSFLDGPGRRETARPCGFCTVCHAIAFVLVIFDCI